MSDLPTPDHAAPFRAMAGKIDTNRDNGFAGAFVIVDPGGKVWATLMIDEAANEASFWSIVKTKSEIALAELEANQQAQAGGFGFGGGRR
jgi:hypothetical protein